MNKITYGEELQVWCDKACSYCYDLVKCGKVNLGFYAFQSAPRLNPEVLILGLNPGVSGDCCGFDINKYPNYAQTLKMFSRANAWFVEKDNWNLWRGLKRIFSYGKLEYLLDQEESFMYINLLYFNTKRFIDFKRNYDPNGEVFERCKNLTEELISSIIKPKRIICLSINECYNRLNTNNTIVYIPSYLTRGDWNGIPIYGIRHTSYGNPAEKVIGECLQYLFEYENRLVTHEEIYGLVKHEIELLKKFKIKRPAETAQEIKLRLEKSLKLKPFDNNNSRLIINDDLQLTLTHSEGGYLAIRHINYNPKQKYTIDNKYYKCEKELKVLLKSFDYEMSDAWLGKRKLNSFGNSEEEVINNIEESLGELLPRIDTICSRCI